MSPETSAIAKQYQKYLEADAAARLKWDAAGKALQRFVRLAKMGRKIQVVVPISASRGVRVTDEWKAAIRNKEEKVFTPAYCKRYSAKEIPLE
jgi:hypothetical protein